MKWRKVRGDGDLNKVFNLVLRDLPEMAEVPFSPRVCSKRLLQVFREARFFEVLEDHTEIYGVLVFSHCDFFDYSDVRTASMPYLIVDKTLPIATRVKMILNGLDRAEKKLRAQSYHVIISDSARPNQAVFRKLLLKAGYEAPKLTPNAYLMKWL